MANTDNAQGFRVIGNPLRVNWYEIEASYGTQINKGDPVTLASGYINRASASDTFLGVALAFRKKSTQAFGHSVDPGDDDYYPASSSDTWECMVADHPDQVFEIQEDSDGGALAAANVGQLGNVVAATGRTTPPYTSKFELDSSTVGSGDQVRLLRLSDIMPYGANTYGTNAKWKVKIAKHLLGEAIA